MCEKRMTKREWHALVDRFRDARILVDLDGKALVRTDLVVLLLLLSRQMPAMCRKLNVDLFNGAVSGHLDARLEVDT